MRLASLMFLLFCATAAQAQQTAYVFMEGTASPTKRYGVVWSLRDKPDLDRTRLKAANQAYIDALNFDEANVENALVDLRGGKVLEKIPEGHFFAIPGGVTRNHADMKVAWSRDEKRMVILYDSRWKTDAVCLYAVSPDGIRREGDFLKPMEQAFRAAAARKYATLYKKVKDSLAVSFSTPVFLDAAQLVVRVDAEVPKQGKGFAGEMRFVLKPEGDSLKAQCVFARVTPVK
jgi:hypothetical protein